MVQWVYSKHDSNDTRYLLLVFLMENLILLLESYFTIMMLLDFLFCRRFKKQKQSCKFGQKMSMIYILNLRHCYSSVYLNYVIFTND